MKKIRSFFPALLLTGLIAAFNSGCDNKPAPSTPPTATTTIPATTANTAVTAPAVVSANKTSFTEVTSQLDPGGNLFFYLGTAQWLEKLSTHTENWRQKVLTMPDLSDENRTNVNLAFDALTRLIKDSGVETVSGLGVSAIEIEPGLYRNKILIHHYPGQGDGFLWQLGGGKAHALTGLDFLPTNTALAFFADADLPLLWKVTQDEVAKSNFPQAQDFLNQLPTQFEANTQVKWDDFLKSLGGEYGFALTLDESNTVPLPLPSGLISIPNPGLLLVIKVNDDTIFNRIDTELKKDGGSSVVSNDKDGLKMRTMPVPIPLPINLRPTLATGGGYLFIGSSDALVNQALAVKSGQQPGLKTTAEFKHLSQNIPDQGNQFTYMSELFGRTVTEVQKQVMAAQGANGQSPEQQAWMQSLFSSYSRMAHAYCVGVNTESGYLSVGNSSQSAANIALLPAVAVPGMLAAIAIPNFVKARATAQENTCINNLRMIDGAKQQWALEKNKKTGDVPTEDDLMPYLGQNGQFPKCPQGGTYTIGAIGEAPTCSVPGHVLPQ